MRNTKEKLISTTLICVLLSLLMVVVLLTANTSHIANASGEDGFIGYSEGIDDLEMTTKNLIPSDNSPSLTILTHGIDTPAKTWGPYKDKFAFDRLSLIETLAGDRENSAVYYAEMKNGVLDFTLSTLSRGDYDTLNKIQKLTIDDVHKHIFIVFKSSDSLAGLDNIYSELNYVIDKLTYDIKYLQNIEPKINLIGDGIGGLVNMMYTINHPNNVADFYSIGTPFSGSSTYSLAKAVIKICEIINKNEEGASEPQAEKTGLDRFFADIKNIIFSKTVEDAINFEYKNKWNKLIEQSNIKAYAIGSAMDFSYIESVATDLIKLMSLPGSISKINTIEDFISFYNSNSFLIKSLLGEKSQYLEMLSFLSDLKKSKSILQVLVALLNELSDNNSPIIKMIGLPESKINSIKGSILGIVAISALYDKLPNLRDRANQLLQELGLSIGIEEIVNTESFNLIEFLNNNPIKSIDTTTKIEGLELTIEDLLGESDKLLMDKIKDFVKQVNIDNDSIFKAKLLKEVLFNLLDEKTTVHLLEDLSELPESKMVEKIYSFLKLFLPVEEGELLDQYIDELVAPFFNFLDDIKIRNKTKYKEWFNKYEKELILLNSGLVDLDSQLAEGYNGVERYIELYTQTYNNKYKLAADLPIGISAFLDSKNSNIINYIVNNIDITGKSRQFRYAQYKFGGIIITGIQNASTIEEVLEIPGEINGHTVKAIAQNAFNNSKMSKVKEIILPNTIEEIGDYAFANCVSLEKIEIPKQVRILNRGIFYNCSSLDVQLPENVLKIEDFAFWNTNIKTVTIPILLSAIGDAVFSNCRNLQSITVDEKNAFYYSIDGVLFEYDSNTIVSYPIGKTQSKYNIDECVVSIRPFAFYNNNLESITLNDGLQTIGAFTFAKSVELSEIILGKSIVCVGDSAFDECLKLKDVIILSEITPILGWDIFDNNAEDRTISVPGFVETKYLELNALKEYADRINILESNIIFEYEGIEPLIVEYGQDISLPKPNRRGYDFLGWYSNNESSIYPSELCWMEYGNIILRAKWEITSYPINFVLGKDNAELNNAPSIYTIEDNFVLPNPNCDGYTFNGWYDNPAGEGDKITTLINNTGAITLYAYWIANTYNIRLELNGSNTDCITESFSVLFGEDVILPIPTRVGYYFDGWFSNAECSGEGLFNDVFRWNIPKDVVLYAKWTIEEYQIKVSVYENDKAVLKWWNEDGLSDNEVHIKYGISVSFYSFFTNYFATTGYRQGYLCKGFESQITAFNNGQWDSVPDLGENNMLIIVNPIWEVEKHSISFSGGGAELQNTLYEGEYGSVIVYPTCDRKGYIFKGWKIISAPFITDSASQYFVGEMFSDITMPDLTPRTSGLGNITIEAQWEAKVCSIMFDSNGGSACESLSVEFDAVLLNLPMSARIGYEFVGWYTDSSFQNTKYDIGDIWKEDMEGIYAPTVTLYAKWRIILYTISFDSDGGPGVKNINYTIESSTFELPIIIKDGLENIGWVNTNHTSEVLTRLEKGRTGNLRLKARWLSSETIKTNNSAYHLSNRQVLLDFSTKSVSVINTTYIIDETVERIALKGTLAQTFSKLRFIIADRNTKLTMTLINFNFTAPDDQNAIYAQDATSATLAKINGTYCMQISGTCTLNLVCKGTSKIRGGARSTYLFENVSKPEKFCSAIVCSKLNISQEETATLYIYGGNGKNGTPSATEAEAIGDLAPRDGKHGGAAIWSTMVNVDISNLYVYGGNGGNGAKGVTGVTGAAGNLDHPNGYEGGTGGIGGNGGCGRYAFNVSKTIYISATSKVYAYGGNGGNGAQGGTGGVGGVGRNGDLKKKVGSGGNGGTGGQGGNRGTGYAALGGAFTLSGVLSNNSKGVDGIAGAGGVGGAGGRGGKKWASSKYGSSGATGANGTPGT